MAVGNARLPSGGIAGPKHGLAAVLHQHQLAFEHVDELVLVLVPVALRRRRAGLEPREVDAELVEPDGIAETLALAPEHGLAERLRVARVGVDLELVDVDLRHRRHTLSTIVAVPMPTPM